MIDIKDYIKYGPITSTRELKTFYRRYQGETSTDSFVFSQEIDNFIQQNFKGLVELGVITNYSVGINSIDLYHGECRLWVLSERTSGEYVTQRITKLAEKYLSDGEDL